MNKHKCRSEQYLIIQFFQITRMWNQIISKTCLEGQPWFLVGNAGYPLSSTLMKPYANPVGHPQRLFNIWLSGACTVMTENICGIWKRCFPVLTNLHLHHGKVMKAVVVTAILHNFAIALGDHDVTDFKELPPYEDIEVVFVEDL